jgi:hypothetical protein
MMPYCRDAMSIAGFCCIPGPNLMKLLGATQGQLQQMMALSKDTLVYVQRAAALSRGNGADEGTSVTTDLDSLLAAASCLPEKMDQDVGKYVRAASAGQPEYLQQAHTVVLEAALDRTTDLHQAGWYLYAWAQSILEQQVDSPKMLEVMLGPAALNAEAVR